MSVHVLQTLVLYECEKHSREEEWEEAHIGDRISGILMQLISCLQVEKGSCLIFSILTNFIISVSPLPSLLSSFS